MVGMGLVDTCGAGARRILRAAATVHERRRLGPLVIAGLRHALGRLDTGPRRRQSCRSGVLRERSMYVDSRAAVKLHAL